MGSWDGTVEVPLGGPATVPVPGSDAFDAATTIASTGAAAGDPSAAVATAVATVRAVCDARTMRGPGIDDALAMLTELLSSLPPRAVSWVARVALACTSGSGAAVGAAARLGNASRSAPGCVGEKRVAAALLHIACRLSAPRFDGKPPSEKDHPVAALLAAGADPNALDTEAARGACPPLANVFRGIAAADLDDDEIEARLGTAQCLVRHGSRAAVPDGGNLTVLSHAALGSHWAAVTYLLNSASVGDLGLADAAAGRTILHHVCSRADADGPVLALLVGKILKASGGAASASGDAAGSPDGGQSSDGKPGPLDPVDAAGLTPAMVALLAGSADAHQLLVSKGCSVTVCDGRGRSLLLLECQLSEDDQESYVAGFFVCLFVFILFFFLPTREKKKIYNF
jgi:hypothetical protein